MLHHGVPLIRLTVHHKNTIIHNLKNSSSWRIWWLNFYHFKGTAVITSLIWRIYYWSFEISEDWIYFRSVEHSLWIESSKHPHHQRHHGANRMWYQAWEWPKYLFGARVTDSIKAFFDRPLIRKNRLFSWEKISKAKLCREIIIGCSETNFCAKSL